MFVIGIFCFIFGLFAWLVYGSKRLIEEVEKEHALIDEVRTYEITDKQYWLCFDTIAGVFFILMGLVFLLMFFFNPPRNNTVEVSLAASMIALIFIGAGVLFIYPNYHYRILTKDRPVTFNPANKSITVGENEEDYVFSITDIEQVTHFLHKGRGLDIRYWEVKLKTGTILLLDPRFWLGMATEKFFRGTPYKVVYQFIPWFRYPVE